MIGGRLLAGATTVALSLGVASATWGAPASDGARSRPITTVAEAGSGAGSAAALAAERAGAKAFLDVALVLQSPRCMNCHPVGDAPLQGDRAQPHAMNVTRASVEAGLACNTCHQERNSEAVGVVAGPPGAPKWALPPRETPMVFQGLSPSALCASLKDPEKNGHRSLDAILEHVSHDPLVMWGWAPGGKRTLPPLSHERFVAAATAWVGSGGACP